MTLRDKFIEGQVLLFDKPLEWTSFDVVNYVRMELRRKLHLKDLKIGHAGTLDPMATGLVIVCTGRMTKRIDEFMSLEKEYIGEMQLGYTTPSFDSETQIDGHYPVDHITEELIYSTTKFFLGEIEQVPPTYSAVKIKGKRAYELIRQGVPVQLKPKIVRISQFDILHIEEYRVTFRVRCSKGTYIRALVRDFGQKIHSGAYLTQLRRTAIGDYLVVNAMSPAEFTFMLNEEIGFIFDNE